MNVELKRYKKEYGHSYSFGVFPTLELLRFRPRDVLGVLVSSKGRTNEGVAKIEEICAKERIEVDHNDRAVERLAPSENSYAIGVFRKYQAHLNDAKDHVVLVNPSDMGNLGTIIRTMLGFGVTDLCLIRPAVDIFDPKVVRASMGALFQLSFEYYDSFEEYRKAFDRNLYPFMTDGKVDLPSARFEEPFTLVFGSEGAGLPEEFHAVGTPVTIPQTRNIDSLNLPVAVSIGLYEAMKTKV